MGLTEVGAAQIGRAKGADQVVAVVRRYRRAVEAAAVAVVSAVLSVVCNLDQARSLTTTAPGDLGDPLYFAWQLAWLGHAIRTDPGGVWTTNAFLRTPDNLAYTDTVWGYLPLSFVVPQGQAGALAQLNLAVLTATAVATAGGYLLARCLGSGIAGALFAGAATAYAPWRLTQVIHINVISTGGIAVTIALLARGHGWSLRDGWRPEQIRPWLIAAGWLAAAWQLTFGFATAIWFIYTLVLLMVAFVLGWLVRGRRRLPLAAMPRGLLIADGVGGVAFLAWLAFMLQPYLWVVAHVGEAKRVEATLDLFSTPWRGLLTAPTTDWFWGDRQLAWRAGLTWPPEMMMSPGVVLIAVAVVGLVYSAWPWRRRLMLAALTASAVVLALGTTAPYQGKYTYLPWYHHLPGWDHLRTPGRMVIWVTFGLALLAAGAVTRLSRDVRELMDAGPGWRQAGWGGIAARSLAALLLAVPAAVVVAEGWNTVPHWQVSTSPVVLADLPQPILVLPSGQVGDYHMMLWSTEGWPTIANGDTGFPSSTQTSLRIGTAAFPDRASIALLRERGIATVVVIRDRAGLGPWAGDPDAPLAGLGITRTEAVNAVIFDVRSQG